VCGGTGAAILAWNNSFSVSSSVMLSARYVA
jgi:hypothetical protein